MKAILDTSFRMEFVYGPDGQALRLSGIDLQDRQARTRQMLRALAEPEAELADLEATDPDRCRILILPSGGGRREAGRLRRGDVASFAATGSEILVAPLLAVERGHNIVISGGKAAIGTVYLRVDRHRDLNVGGPDGFPHDVRQHPSRRRVNLYAVKVPPRSTQSWLPRR